ncbi:prephenate dehydratase [Jannaschia seohaensis]|uniref:prephenate dehydratase n=1 Tax=Jannaschia seohaensis TaxID=475081 RepID=A0A2Y9A2J2_9RHOB|nr:prephenate dehydratase [Jannaschia seohaensis]PWJ22376.1 prephenate dehydratase [Jannaschia seohaensis]SSA38654.1 prephenate dehydratase [Jannaschia seohaensis]
MSSTIAFQGDLGSYSHQASVEAFPDHAPVPCTTFEDALAAVREGRADLGMIAIENSTYGRVADVHRLLPHSGLRIVGEAFVRVRIALMARAGVRLEDIKRVRAHLVLLPQCAAFLREHGIQGEPAADSAGAASELARSELTDEGVLASELAASIHGLEVLARDIEDHGHNTTRFLVMAREPQVPPPGAGPVKTTFVFQVRNIPAALYKAMGGFATNGVNMTKLESYMIDGRFTATQFYADIEGHPEDPPVARALEELRYFTTKLDILGVYPADPDHFDGGAD